MSLTKNTPAIRALIIADVRNTEGAFKSRFAVVDAMVAAGQKSTDWISPKAKDSGSTATPEDYGWKRESVILGFNAADQALLRIESKAAVAALKPEKAARRTYVQQQIGSRMKDYKNALKRREEAPQDGAGGRKRPAMDRFLDLMSKAINVLRTESDFTFDAPEMILRLQKEVNLAKVSK
jgi:hypothetical protein